MVAGGGGVDEEVEWHGVEVEWKGAPLKSTSLEKGEHPVEWSGVAVPVFVEVLVS